MKCKKCGAEPPDGLLEGICADCIFKAAEKLGSLTKADIERVRREKATIEAETKGLFLSPGLLRGVLDDLLEAVEGGEDRELCLTKATNAVQKLGGIGMCREMIRMTEALGDFALKLEEEARRRLKTLSKLGEE